MSTQLAVRKPPTFGGKRFELIPEKPAAVPVMHEDVTLMAHNMVPAISTSGPKEVNTNVYPFFGQPYVKKEYPIQPYTKADMFELFAKHAQGVRQWYDATNTFLEKVFVANLTVKETWNYFKLKPWIDGTASQLVQLASASIPYRDGPTRPAEIAVLSDLAQVATKLTEALHFTCYSLVSNFFSALDRLVDSEVVGQIVWESPTVCSFHFYTWSITDRCLAERKVQHNKQVVTGPNTADIHVTTTTERDLERTVRHGIHYHEVMEANKLSVNEPSVKKPERVKHLLENMPAWLQPLAQLVTGKEIYRTVAERVVASDTLKEVSSETKVHTIRFQNDPCIVIGDKYVVCGWSDDEVES